MLSINLDYTISFLLLNLLKESVFNFPFYIFYRNDDEEEQLRNEPTEEQSILITKIKERYNPNLTVGEASFKIKVDPSHFIKFQTITDALKDIFDSIVNSLTNFASDNEGIRGMTLILNTDIGSKFYVSIPFESIDSFDSDVILNSIEGYVQSNEVVTMYEMEATITTVYKNGTVGHAPSLKYKSELDDMSKFLNISTIPTSFYEPGAKGCFFLALAYRLLTQHSHCPRKARDFNEACRLAMQCEIEYRADIGYGQIQTIEQKLDLRFVVLKTDSATQTLEQFYLSTNKDITKPLIMFLLHKECYYTFTSFRNILRDNVYGKQGGICIHCNEIVRNYTGHITNCVKRCNACYFPLSLCPTPTLTIPQNREDNQKHCSDCHRSFLFEQCFENHKKDLSHAMISCAKSRGKQKNFSICGKIRKCNKCSTIISDLNNSHIKSRHDCKKLNCSVCHVSYITLLKINTYATFRQRVSRRLHIHTILQYTMIVKQSLMKMLTTVQIVFMQLLFVPKSYVVNAVMMNQKIMTMYAQKENHLVDLEQWYSKENPIHLIV